MNNIGLVYSITQTAIMPIEGLNRTDQSIILIRVQG